MAVLSTLLFLTTATLANAKVLPRDPVVFSGTLTIPIPTGNSPFTTTVPACSATGGIAVPSFVVVGDPIGSFVPGTRTIRVPPQCEPTTRVFTDGGSSNETEVIIVKPLPGECGIFEPPSPPEETPTAPGGTELAPQPTATDVCPSDGCTGEVLKGASVVIGVINKVTQLSQNLQTVALKIGETSFPFFPGEQGEQVEQGDLAAPQLLFPIIDVARGLTQIVTTITISAPTLTFLPPFPPGCSADTIIVAFVEFVEVHQRLLSILIGRSGFLQRGPFKRSDGTQPHEMSDVGSGVMVAPRAESGFIGKPIAIALRALEGVVDTLALALIRLVPGGGPCAKAKKEELAESIRQAQTSYES